MLKYNKMLIGILILVIIMASLFCFSYFKKKNIYLTWFSGMGTVILVGLISTFLYTRPVIRLEDEKKE